MLSAPMDLLNKKNKTKAKPRRPHKEDLLIFVSGDEGGERCEQTGGLEILEDTSVP